MSELSRNEVRHEISHNALVTVACTITGLMLDNLTGVIDRISKLKISFGKDWVPTHVNVLWTDHHIWGVNIIKCCTICTTTSSSSDWWRIWRGMEWYRVMISRYFNERCCSFNARDCIHKFDRCFMSNMLLLMMMMVKMVLLRIAIALRQRTSERKREKRTLLL